MAMSGAVLGIGPESGFDGALREQTRVGKFSEKRSGACLDAKGLILIARKASDALGGALHSGEVLLIKRDAV